MTAYRVEAVAPDDDDVSLVERELRAFNRGALGDYAYEPLAFVLRGPRGEVAGGVDGLTGLGWLHVATLWVDDAVRGLGHGRALLLAAEGEAQRRGCHGSYLFTFDFQAPSFYRAMGYETFGVLEDFPPGMRRWFLRKAL